MTTGPQQDAATHDWFTAHFRAKIEDLCRDLESLSMAINQSGVSCTLSGPVLLDQFHLVMPDDTDKVLSRSKPTSSQLDPSLS